MPTRILLWPLCLLSLLAISVPGSAQAAQAPLFEHLSVVLLRDPAIQKEVALQAAQKSKIEAEYKRFTERMKSIGKSAPKNQAEAQAMGKKAQAEQIALANAILVVLQPWQKSRLREVALQSYGPFALAAPDIAKAVGITEAQRNSVVATEAGFGKKIQALQAKRIEEVRAVPQPKNPNDKKAVDAYKSKITALAEKHAAADRKTLTAAKKAAENKVLALLSPAQRTKWNSLLGKPYKAAGQA